MTEQGIVLSVKDNFAKVRVGRNAACASCGKCGMTESQKHVDFYADNHIGAKSGDTVTLDIPETNSAHLAFIGYFVPLVPALVLLFVALALQWAEWLAIVLFFAGLAVGFAVLALVDKLRKHKWMETPVISSIVHSTGSSESYTISSIEGEHNNEQNN